MRDCYYDRKIKNAISGRGVVVATDSVSIGTHKEGTPVKAKIGGDVMKYAAVVGGVPANANLIFFSLGNRFCYLFCFCYFAFYSYDLEFYSYVYICVSVFSYVSVKLDHSYLKFLSLR